MHLSEAKVKLSLCFNWAPLHECVLGEWRYSFTHSLTSVLDGSEWSASRANRFTPRKRAPVSFWIRGWVGLRAGLDPNVKHRSVDKRRCQDGLGSHSGSFEPVKIVRTSLSKHGLKTGCVSKSNWSDNFTNAKLFPCTTPWIHMGEWGYSSTHS